MATFFVIRCLRDIVYLRDFDIHMDPWKRGEYQLKDGKGTDFSSVHFCYSDRMAKRFIKTQIVDKWQFWGYDVTEADFESIPVDVVEPAPL